MIARKSRKAVKYIIILTGAGAIIFFFLLLGPPKLLAKSESPVFCSGCHVMEANFEAWAHTGAHRRIKCVDCHLPNENTVVHYIWKSIDGLKDIGFFYSGRVPDPIRLTSHGAEVLQKNCVRCHETTVEFINHERQCWECHRRLMHKRSGAIETI